MSAIFDSRPCKLGEGPLWHPVRQQLFWFDILGKRLLSRKGDDTRDWRFGECVSAAGWIDRDRLLIASETALFTFDLVSGTRRDVITLEADNPVTRSNDGRADPWGGFWIGTMGKNAEPGAGAIYRLYRGELRRLYSPITVANSICFSPDRSHACFSDTITRQVMRQALEPETGWPLGDPEVYLDHTEQGLNPDGAVMDADGNLWLAQWGALRVACYAPDGTFLRAVRFDALQTSCPAFGGPDLTTLYCTSATQGMRRSTLAAHPANGMTFAAPGIARGQPEHRVRL
ncbi:SMP-30/gluconolactonase/LRE family protein [Pukyongiella litopenaei]|uniref:SMP-30/gluconolactonase/LRE family protein n=1 Tax=Pukyongiella litopenaei TaxID=2605946 RepID=A0A2S0MSV2_9RHOB|nr:SMP-30/gluconolactonase/LRE family protein [Pukyongiella litopenaei]AVO38965.1 SMP-30/gluconolactonase/LRE family protein [Pukyongiella litopenaei]